MEVKELRIGNWVRLSFEHATGWHQAKVVGIHSDNTIDTDTGFGDGGKYYYEAIALTPEILEKCGFKKKELKSSWTSRLEIFWIIETAAGISIGYHEGNATEGSLFHMGTEIPMSAGRYKYLHQLQNLFYALTGEELNIAL